MVATALVLMADRLDSPIVTISTAIIIICREISFSHPLLPPSLPPSFSSW